MKHADGYVVMAKLTGVFFLYYAKAPKKIILQPSCVVDRLDVADSDMLARVLVCVCVCVCVCTGQLHRSV